METEYYLHTLYLCEDQDGNLYDTERLDVFRFEDYIEEHDGAVRPKPKPEFGNREAYYSYAPAERQALIAAFSNMGHDRARILNSGSKCS